MIGRIYKISSPEVPGVCYIGSTTQTCAARWDMHKVWYNQWVFDNSITIAIYPYFKEHGIDKFEMTLIKEYRVEDTHHLRAYEQLWMNKYCKSAVNKRAACQLVSTKTRNRIYMQHLKRTDPEEYKRRSQKAKALYFAYRRRSRR